MRNGTVKKAQKERLSQRSEAFVAACKKAGLQPPDVGYDAGFGRIDFLFEGDFALMVEGVTTRQFRNEAVNHGFWLLYCTPEELETGEAIALVKRALEAG